MFWIGVLGHARLNCGRAGYIDPMARDMEGADPEGATHWSAPEFCLEASMSDFGTLTMSVQGELELATASDLVDELGEWLGIKECIIELDGCDFIDSVGIRALIECRHQIGPQGTLRLVGLAPHIERLLRQVGLHELAGLEAAPRASTLERDRD